jgi:hypothetical protein
MSAAPRRPISIDGFRRPLPKRPATVQVPPRPVVKNTPMPAPAEPILPVSEPTVAKQPRWSWKVKLQWAAIILVGVIVGLIVQAIPLGYLAVVGYCAMAIVKRIPSRLTFMLALGALGLAPLGIIAGSGAAANGFSLLGFLLLSVGVVTLGIELNKERRPAHREHGTGSPQ